MRTSTGLAWALAVALGSFPAVSTELSPQEILRRSDARMQSLRSVRYTVESIPHGVSDGFVHPTSGDVVLARSESGDPVYFIEIRSTKPRTKEKAHWVSGFDGTEYFLIDHIDRTVYQDMDPDVLGLSQRFLFLAKMPEYVVENPFSDELTAESVELLDPRHVGGVRCHAVQVKYADSQDWSIWLISTEDFLPRGRERHFTIPEGTGAIVTTITDLEVDPDLDAGLFVLEGPDGYTRVDDFAP